LGYVVGWTNQEQKHKKGSVIELVSDSEGDTKFPNDEMVVANEEIRWNVKHERSKFIGGVQQLKHNKRHICGNGHGVNTCMQI
jgi:hypothetical protein